MNDKYLIEVSFMNSRYFCILNLVIKFCICNSVFLLPNFQRNTDFFYFTSNEKYNKKRECFMVSPTEINIA